MSDDWERRYQQERARERKREENEAAVRESLLPWLAVPCSRRRNKWLPGAAVLATLHHLFRVRGHLRVRRSDRSNTLYISGEPCISDSLRVSDHDLGWADYGSRQQTHNGAEFVFTTRSPLPEPAEFLAEMIADVREQVSGTQHGRREIADLLRGLRRTRAWLVNAG